MERRHELRGLQEVNELIGLKDPMRVIKKLMDAGVLMLAEETEGHLQAPHGAICAPVPGRPQRGSPSPLVRYAGACPKQLHLLMRYIELSRCLSDDPREVRRDELLKRSDASAAELE
ncbi:MAG: hypothetical protein IPH00_11675 [Flavobacteriales bacterium]|nr:hypothetical protein [Flavobacteriales bacterium]